MSKGKEAQLVSRRIHQLWEDGWWVVLNSPGWFNSSKVATIKQRKMTIMSRSQVSRKHSAKTYWIHYLHSRTWQPVPRRRRKPDGDPYLRYHGWYGGQNCSQCYKNWWETVQFVCQWAVCLPVTQPFKKNNLPTFTSSNKKTVSKDKTKVEVLKDDCALLWEPTMAAITFTAWSA